jgi:hypothetical protein
MGKPEKAEASAPVPEGMVRVRVRKGGRIRLEDHRPDAGPAQQRIAVGGEWILLAIADMGIDTIRAQVETTEDIERGEVEDDVDAQRSEATMRQFEAMKMTARTQNEAFAAARAADERGLAKELLAKHSAPDEKRMAKELPRQQGAQR